MKDVNKTALSICVVMLVISCSFGILEATQKENLGTISATACKDYGVVSHVSKGSKGIPIIVLEETHESIAGQIQHAITLVRLHDKYKMKDIALEGYLKERAKIDTEWFKKATHGLEFLSKAGIAVSLLKEGDISSAEFMKLVYDDVTLHPIETKREYELEINPEIANKGLNSYLGKIAAQSSENSKWVEEKVKMLNDTTKIKPLEENLTIGEDIKRRAERLSLKFTSDEQKAFESYLTFLRKRVKSNKILFDSTIAIANQQNIPFVLMIIGAGHTQGISKMLDETNRPFAVITSLALKNNDKRGSLPWKMYERKYKRLSVFSEGFFMETILKAFPLTHKNRKPEPVLNEEWFKCKGTIYAWTTRICESLIGGGSGKQPPGGGGPPWGFSSDEFNFNRKLFIDPNQIKIVYNDEKKREGKAVLLPLVFYPDDSGICQ